MILFFKPRDTLANPTVKIAEGMAFRFSLVALQVNLKTKQAHNCYDRGEDLEKRCNRMVVFENMQQINKYPHRPDQRSRIKALIAQLANSNGLKRQKARIALVQIDVFQCLRL